MLQNNPVRQLQNEHGNRVVSIGAIGDEQNGMCL